MEQLNTRKFLLNIPNILTIIRIILVIPIICILLVDDFSFAYNFEISNITFNITWNQVIVGILFLIASFTDFLDGYLSRKFNRTSDFGKFWDPLADKILVNSIFILLAIKNYVYVIFPIIFIIRDIIIDGLRMFASNKKYVIPANMFGKFKTVFQIIAITILLFVGTSNDQIVWWYWGILNLFVYISCVVSLLSLGLYSINFFRISKHY